MKTGFTVCFALCLGCVIAYWLFGLAFHMNIQRFNHAAFAPILVGLIGSLMLVLVHPSAMKWSATGILAPTLLLNGLFFLGVVAEGRGAEWSHLTTILKVAAAVFAGTIIGWVIRRVIRKQRAG
jgi:hypothetical protein